jgi:hypothetical protein
LSARESWDAGAASSFAETRLSFPFDHYDIGSIGNFRLKRLSWTACDGDVNLAPARWRGRDWTFNRWRARHRTDTGASGCVVRAVPPNGNSENVLFLPNQEVKYGFVEGFPESRRPKDNASLPCRRYGVSDPTRTMYGGQSWDPIRPGGPKLGANFAEQAKAGIQFGRGGPRLGSNSVVRDSIKSATASIKGADAGDNGRRLSEHARTHG